MFTTKFSFNWNGKLYCTYFTTLRGHNPKIFYSGAQHTILLNNKKIKEAEVIEVKPLKLLDLNPFIAGLDTGYTPVQTIDMLEKMHKKHPPKDGLYDLVLFKTTKIFKEPDFILSVLKQLMSV